MGATLQDEAHELHPLQRFATYFIVLYHIVPISLYVCFELLKLVLVFQLNTDAGMADPDTGVFSVARTSDLIEEMGQIDFIFSDKTGTLTKNEMVFAKACIGGQDLGDFRRGVDGREPDTIQRLREGLRNPQNTSVQYWKDVNWFFTCLATCNTVQVAKERDAREEILIRNDVSSRPSGRSVNPAAKHCNTEISDIPEEIQYLGMSPDEVALVGAAQSVGIVFSSRQHHKSRSSSTASEVCVSYPDATTKTFAVVYELEFTSERKRMSVILRLGSEIILVTKGADSVIEGLLQEPISMAYRDRLKEYSQSGLRTLLVAYKRIDRHAFRKWDKEYKEAQNITDGNKAEQVLRLQAEMETGLKLVGITAVEDCLQDGVPEAIATIKEAGIRLWVLTGDKTETAVDIARSCYIFTDSTRVAYATGATSEEEAFQKLEIAKDQIEGSNAADAGLVLDGGTLQYCFGSERCKQHILDIGLSSRSCVCCRLNPLQKRNIIDIVKKRDKRIITLAIGDGANDVPMIEGAHLGVGVRGKEGAQAVQVSDVAISQFRFLVPLLLCHGRRAYRRIALFLCYYLYKNVALLMGDVVWMIMDNFRGRIAFPEYVSIQYNVLFTSWHILFVLGFDVDVSDEVATRNPNLYLVGPRRELFNARVFCLWMICGVIHGIVAWTVPALWIIDGAEYDKDSPGKFWEGSITAFTIVILLVSIKLLITCQSPLKIKTSILPTLAAIFCYVVWTAGVVPYVPPLTSWQPSMEGIGTNLAGNTNALISMVAVPAAVTTVDLVIAMVKTRLMPSELDRLRRGQREDQQLKSNVEVDVEV
jgi:phospholipid-translocating P-type ATPase (flippase)